MKIFRKCFFVLMVSSLFFVPLSYAQVITDFESGTLEFWDSEGDGYCELEDSTGNPGGCMRVNDYATGPINKAIAPYNYIGNWSNATVDDSICYDYKIVTGGGSYTSNWAFEIYGPGGSAIYIPPVPNPQFNVWNSYSAKIDSTQWDIQTGTWSALMDYVDLIKLRAEFVYGDEYVLLDNITLSFSPSELPVEPLVCTNFEDGFDGWVFENTGGVSIQSTGGNPDSYCRISDASDTSFAIAPPKFLGDWTLLEDVAEILVDFKIISHSGPIWLADYFIKISGPGGVATVSADSSKVNNALDTWETFSFMISESQWDVLSGDWDSILNEVSQVKIVAEFIDGAETVGMDNIKISDDPPQADFYGEPLFTFCGGSVQFYDTSTNDPNAWLWDFGDRDTSTDQNPLHVFNVPGFHDVQLTAFNHFGNNVALKQNYIEIADTSGNELFCDDFTGTDIHPAWSFRNGTWSQYNDLRQTSNYYGAQWIDGCFALVGLTSFSNYTLTVDFNSTDNDGIGAVFNYQDENNFYLFVWCAQDNYRALVRIEDGVETELIKDTIAYTLYTWYNLKIDNSSGHIICYIDDTEIFNVQDTAFTNGKAGLYCWGNDGSFWDNFCINRSQLIGIPQDVEIDISGSIVTVTWDTVPTATSYAIYSSTNPNEQPQNWTLEESGISDTTWTEAAGGEKKFYYVKSIK